MQAFSLATTYERSKTLAHLGLYLAQLFRAGLLLTIPPALEKVIFSVVSACLSVYLFALCRLIRWTYGPKIWHPHYGSKF